VPFSRAVDHAISLDVGAVELAVDRTGLAALIKACAEVVKTCTDFVQTSSLGEYLLQLALKPGTWKKGVGLVLVMDFFRTIILCV
jgi:hypothetical protein